MWCFQLQLPFPGTLYITAQHTCFSSCTRDGQEIVVKVQHGQVKASNKIQPKKRGNALLQSLDLMLAVLLCVCCSSEAVKEACTASHLNILSLACRWQSIRRSFTDTDKRARHLFSLPTVCTPTAG